MEILAVGKYSKHIALFAKLLRIPDLCISYKNERTDDDLLKTYYKKVSNAVTKETQFDLRHDALEFVNLNNCAFDEDINQIVIDCDGDDINGIENSFINVIKDVCDLNGDNMITNSILNIIKREPNEKEIVYHIANNERKNINVFVWICILNFCDEAKNLNYRTVFDKSSSYYKKNESHPKIAVIFCGYLRNYKYVSHMPIINSPHTDIFIHTWNETGFKNEKRFMDNSWLSKKKTPIDVDLIKSQYKPVKILVENNEDLLDSFSLSGKISPIFLYSGQAKDDATKYINSQLYSINAAYKLICEYEIEQGFKYDAIIKLRFDYNISHLNFTKIQEEIADDCMYFPHANCNSHKHAGGGGGCISCDKLLAHDDHTNDLCDIWFYGNRETAWKGCEIFETGLKILKDNHDNNMLELSKQTTYCVNKDGFVYISSTKDIENKYVCFYPERLLREAYKGTPCKSSKSICGRI